MANRRFRKAIRATWRFFWRPSTRWPLGLILIVGIGVGAAAFGGYNGIVVYTNRMSFCIKCHEMHDFVYKDYIHSVHYKNPAGVRAECKDCHEPPEWGPQLVAKMGSYHELFHHIFHHWVQSIWTRKKFEKYRPELDKSVWAGMKANDSRNCRKCHTWSAMLTSAQPFAARTAHRMGHKHGLTCIDCHKGIMRLKVNFKTVGTTQSPNP